MPLKALFLVITLSLGSIETDRVISEPCYNEVIFYRHDLGAMTWPCYIENRIIMRRVIMRLKCTSLSESPVCFRIDQNLL